MDAADIAGTNDYNEEALSKMRMSNSRRAQIPRGECLFCYEPVEATRIFCDAYCREDYEKQELKIKRITS